MIYTQCSESFPMMLSEIAERLSQNDLTRSRSKFVGRPNQNCLYIRFIFAMFWNQYGFSQGPLIYLSSRRSSVPESYTGGLGELTFDKMEPPDLKGLKNLDPQTITAIHNFYYPVIYRYARYRLSDETVVEDVVSETFVRLLEAVKAKKGPRKSLRGWLLGTVSNLVNDHYRKKYSRKMQSLSEELHSDVPGPVKVIETLEEHEAVRSAFSKLTSEQQHVLALRFGSGLTLEETANVIGKKVNAVKQLQFRALGALRRNVGVDKS